MVNCVFNTLSKGNKGPNQTKVLQHALGIKEDGIYGPITEASVKAYQKRRGLVIDGIAGQITCTALGIWCTKPGSSTKVCSPNTTFMMQRNNYTCGVTCLMMAATRHGLTVRYDTTMEITGCNPTNGTGHGGMKAFIKSPRGMGLKYAESFYRKDLSIDGLRQAIRDGFDVYINLMTGGLVGWGGNWPHWVLVQCIDDDYVYIHDPDRGPMIKQTRSAMEKAMDNNGNPDSIIAK